MKIAPAPGLALLAFFVGHASPAVAQCQVAKLTAPTLAQGDEFGYAGAIDGDWAIVGAYLNDDRAFQGGVS